jgi:hypothetical protein
MVPRFSPHNPLKVLQKYKNISKSTKKYPNLTKLHLSHFWGLFFKFWGEIRGAIFELFEWKK